MIEFIAGLLLIAVWGILFFVARPATGWIHLALGLGVVLVVRGIAVSRWGTPPAR
ncbi:MAG TPA: hypothetical protein VHW65_02230 [Gemmatimonadales bacterium]|nr:hypothetical protein [Gemmatimonadales bacterium]